MIDKNYIISEIKRTASENDGVALGKEKFFTITGIQDSTWWGKYWRSWGDALKEAGFSENKLNIAHDKTFLVASLTKLTHQIGKFPASVDLRIARRSDETFPSHNTFDSLGPKSTKIALVREYATKHKEYSGVLVFLPHVENAEEMSDCGALTNTKTKEGFVYLGMLKIDSKKRYKIGKTNLVERRNTELSLQLPEKLELVHYIKTDDISGIEAYWHKRFADKNTNGEWFHLSNDEVRAFKLRRFM